MIHVFRLEIDRFGHNECSESLSIKFIYTVGSLLPADKNLLVSAIGIKEMCNRNIYEVVEIFAERNKNAISSDPKRRIHNA